MFLGLWYRFKCWRDPTRPNVDPREVVKWLNNVVSVKAEQDPRSGLCAMFGHKFPHTNYNFMDYLFWYGVFWERFPGYSGDLRCPVHNPKRNRSAIGQYHNAKAHGLMWQGVYGWYRKRLAIWIARELSKRF